MEKKSDNLKTKRKVKSVRATGEKEIRSDVLGSYTGIPESPDEKPVQDADDL